MQLICLFEYKKLGNKTNQEMTSNIRTFTCP